MLWGEPVAQIAERVAGIRAEAARHGRTVRFSLSVRPIVGQTEEAAWQRAEEIRAATETRVAGTRGPQIQGTHVQRTHVQGTQAQGTPVQGIQVPDTPGPARRLFGFRESSSVGSERLQQQAAEREVYDERLWYGVTRLTGPGGNSTALVGTAAQVADALMAYRRVGVDTVLIRGFDPLDDVVEWGRELVPLLREEAARTPVGAPGAAEGALTA
jgi:alkanesulfonate monooxygenase